jgi:hypothetical protein
MRFEIEPRAPYAVTDIWTTGGSGLSGRVLVSVWQTRKAFDLSMPSGEKVLMDSFIKYPHNLIGLFARRAISQLGVRVLGELEGGKRRMGGYGRPDLTDRSLKNIVECGVTISDKLVWCLENGRTFWWAGLLSRYDEWRGESPHPPLKDRFVLVRFSKKKGRPRRLLSRYNRLTISKEE